MQSRCMSSIMSPRKIPASQWTWRSPFSQEARWRRLERGTVLLVDHRYRCTDFTTPNPAYWRFVDTFLNYCESSGILVFLFPAYVGYAGREQGWMQEMVANGPSKVRAYGAWLASRYKHQRNIVWMMGGDLGAFSPSQTAVESALLAGLKSVPGQQSTQFSAEWDSESIGTDQRSFGSSMTLNGVYSWSGKVSILGRRAYAHYPTLPAFLLEEPYDEEGPDGNSVNPDATQPVRRFQWWELLITIAGYISGNGYIVLFSDAHWKNHLGVRATCLGLMPSSSRCRGGSSCHQGSAG